MLHIRLFGRPHFEAHGEPVASPFRRKGWALLAVLLLADRPPSRRSLADLLFPDADDPLGALRWTLSQLRRAARGHLHVDGDPVVLRLAADCRVDVADLLGNRDGTDEADTVTPLGTLLEGADGIAGPEFDLWLTAARHRLDAVRGASLRRAAERAMARSDPALAVAASVRAVEVTPNEAAARGLLVGSLVAAGDPSAALAQLAQWSAAIRQDPRLGQPVTPVVPVRGHLDRGWADADASALITAGEAALGAGAASAGLDHLRDAVRLASLRDNDRLRATASLALGSNVVHAVAAHAEEGRRALRDAHTLARRTGQRDIAAEALRDLAYVENATGRVEATRRLLGAATATAGDDTRAMSSVRAIEGMFLADRGQHGLALRALRDSVRLAESTERMRQAAWSMSMASRSLIQRDERDTARDHAERSLRIATEKRWTAMLPWIEAILAELDLADGRIDEAERRLRHAWSMSLVLGDRCWQAIAARGLGLVGFARADLVDALHWLDEAGRRATEGQDRYAWIHAWVQEAICRVTVTARLPRAPADTARLGSIAAQTRQPEFLIRANLHRAALGDRSALDRARTLVSHVDNPALRRATRSASVGRVSELIA